MEKHAPNSPSSPICRVIVTLRRAGFHHWPGAPDNERHLADRHRHQFTFRAEFGVKHGDREVEFHAAQAMMIEALMLFEWSVHGIEFGARSCEQIAVALHDALSALEPCAIEVWEDDEHGARLEWQ